jgi:hypothetical protein
MITLFTYQEWRLWLTGWHGPAVFLDKTCIHQTDHDLQINGIRKLGAFLKSSRCMVVLYGKEYLQKLWTVYEVASFLTLRPGSQIWVIPVYFPVVAFMWQQVIFIQKEVDQILQLRFAEGVIGADMLSVIFGSVCIIIMSWCLRAWN